MNPTLQELSAALHASWSADTAYDPEDWSRENNARGQCVVSSLVVQDYFGGDLLGYAVREDSLRETHYMNRLPDGTIVDTTASQYTSPVAMQLKTVNLGEFASVRDKRLADTSTQKRYEILKERVAQVLVGKQEAPLIAGTYRHYKGNEYKVLYEATDTETGQRMVVYRALYEPYKVWVRPFNMFFETVLVNGEEIPRFTRIDR